MKLKIVPLETSHFPMSRLKRVRAIEHEGGPCALGDTQLLDAFLCVANTICCKKLVVRFAYSQSEGSSFSCIMKAKLNISITVTNRHCCLWSCSHCFAESSVVISHFSNSLNIIVCGKPRMKTSPHPNHQWESSPW